VAAYYHARAHQAHDSDDQRQAAGRDLGNSEAISAITDFPKTLRSGTICFDVGIPSVLEFQKIDFQKGGQGNARTEIQDR
jgi:hypothetical protein